MKNKRIIIIGCSGSGKSTLSKQLNKATGIPVVHLDKLYWKSGWVHVSNEEFDKLLQNELEKEMWIMDGNFDRTLETRFDKCDTVIYLDFSRFICLLSALKRVTTNLGKTRSDMSLGCPEKYDLEFLKWIWNFNKTHRKEYYKRLMDMSGKEIFILHKRNECKILIEKLKKL